MREYFGPLLLALLLHAGVAAALARGWERAPQAPRVVRPNHIEAKLLVMEPRQAQPRIQPPPRPSATPPATARPPPPPPRAQPAPAPEPDADAARRAEEERQRTAREARLRALAQETLHALDEEAAALEQSATEQAAMSYMAAIQRAIVQAWSRPPSARNGMKARLEILLAPTGELLSVALLDSSGSVAFDRSAEQAVRKVRRFEVPEDRRLFEAEFRRFTMLFRPEDLLR